MRGLDRKIDIERKTAVSDGYGQGIETWSKIATRRSAWVAPVRGDERFTSEQLVARQQTEFRVRYSSEIADLSPLDRIIYPATSIIPRSHEIYDIIEVAELGRREALRIITARRAEIANA